MDAVKVKENLELIEKAVVLKPLPELPNTVIDDIIATALQEILTELQV